MNNIYQTQTEHSEKTKTSSDHKDSNFLINTQCQLGGNEDDSERGNETRYKSQAPSSDESQKPRNKQGKKSQGTKVEGNGIEKEISDIKHDKDLTDAQAVLKDNKTSSEKGIQNPNINKPKSSEFQVSEEVQKLVRKKPEETEDSNAGGILSLNNNEPNSSKSEKVQHDNTSYWMEKEMREKRSETKDSEHIEDEEKDVETSDIVTVNDLADVQLELKDSEETPEKEVQTQVENEPEILEGSEKNQNGMKKKPEETEDSKKIEDKEKDEETSNIEDVIDLAYAQKELKDNKESCEKERLSLNKNEHKCVAKIETQMRKMPSDAKDLKQIKDKEKDEKTSDTKHANTSSTAQGKLTDDNEILEKGIQSPNTNEPSSPEFQEEPKSSKSRKRKRMKKLQKVKVEDNEIGKEENVNNLSDLKGHIIKHEYPQQNKDQEKEKEKSDTKHENDSIEAQGVLEVNKESLQKEIQSPNINKPKRSELQGSEKAQREVKKKSEETKASKQIEDKEIDKETSDIKHDNDLTNVQAVLKGNNTSPEKGIQITNINEPLSSELQGYEEAQREVKEKPKETEDSRKVKEKEKEKETSDTKHDDYSANVLKYSKQSLEKGKQSQIENKQKISEFQELEDLQQDNTFKWTEKIQSEVKKKPEETKDLQQIEDKESDEETSNTVIVNQSTGVQLELTDNEESPGKEMQSPNKDESNSSEFQGIGEVQHDTTCKLREKIQTQVEKKPKETEFSKQIEDLEKTRGTSDNTNANYPTDNGEQLTGNDGRSEKGTQTIDEYAQLGLPLDATSSKLMERQKEVERPEKVENSSQIGDLKNAKGNSVDSAAKIKCEVSCQETEQEQIKVEKLEQLQYTKELEELKEPEGTFDGRIIHHFLDTDSNSNTEPRGSFTGYCSVEDTKPLGELSAHAPQVEPGKTDSKNIDSQSRRQRKTVTDSLRQKRSASSVDSASNISSEAIPKEFKIIMASSAV